ncbi:MAG: hypothetical protein ACRDHW_00135 [Ktedonobacteraceae bacterium]
MNRKVDRVYVSGLFHAHLDALEGVQIAGPGNTKLSHWVRIDWQDHYAVCLVKSSDYWYHRLQLTAPGVSLVVCMRHDTVLAQDVLELRTGRHYKPYEEPLLKPPVRNNRYASLIVLGQLLAGEDTAWQRLKDFPESTRFRYLSSVKRFSKKRQGKPLAV